MGEDFVAIEERTKPELMRQALEGMQAGSNISQLAKELGVSRRTLYRWKDKQLGRKRKGRKLVSRETKLEAEIQRLKQSLANRTLEVDFFKGALQKVEARRRNSGNSGARAFTTKSGE
jgi:transposase-like protein